MDVSIGSDRPTELVAWKNRIEEAFEAYPSEKLVNIFNTLKMVYGCVIEAGGDNNYKLPHKKGENKVKVPVDRA